MNDVKQPSEACMMCTISGDTFFSFTKSMWIGDSSSLCHIMNNDTSLFNVININKLIQGSSSIMPVTKEGKLHVNIWQVNRTEWVHTIWPIKFCPKGGANLFLLTCELLQEKTLSIDHGSNIMVKYTDGNIILDCQIKNHDGWVARLEFVWKINDERAQSAMAPHKKNMNNLHVELSHPSESITHATTKALGI